MTVASPAAAATPAYDRADWASSFRNVSVELSDEPLTAARGAIPAGPTSPKAGFLAKGNG